MSRFTCASRNATAGPKKNPSNSRHKLTGLVVTGIFQKVLRIRLGAVSGWVHKGNIQIDSKIAPTVVSKGFTKAL